MADDSGILGILFDTVNMAVEQYLAHVIKPFLTLHEKFYKALNSVLRTFLDDNSDNIPKWFTANAITYVRTWMVIPNLLLLVHGYNFLPFLIVLGVDFGDFLDGVVARYWVDRKHIEAVGEEVPGDDSKDKPKMMASEIVKHREKNYGGFIDAVCDKAFVVPCWISLLSTVPSAGCVRTIQFIVLWCLILTETASGCIRFKAYYSSNGVAAPTVKGLDFSTSAVKVRASFSFSFLEFINNLGYSPRTICETHFSIHHSTYPIYRLTTLVRQSRLSKWSELHYSFCLC